MVFVCLVVRLGCRNAFIVPMAITLKNLELWSVKSVGMVRGRAGKQGCRQHFFDRRGGYSSLTCQTLNFLSPLCEYFACKRSV